MKQRVKFLIFLLFLFPILNLSALALSHYTDDLNSVYSNHIKSYYNLLPVQSQSGELLDSNYSTIGNPALKRGGVIYRVKNATNLQIFLNSNHGTQVTQGEGGTYTLGSPLVSGGASTTVKPLFSPLYDQVYIQTARGLEALSYSTEKGYVFTPTTQAPTDLQPYGLQVSVSADGKTYQRVVTTLTKYQFLPQTGIHWEEHSSQIPPNIAFIKVEINDLYQVPLVGGGSLFKNSETMTKLARVNLLGTNMELGAPVNLQKEEDPFKPSKTDSKEDEDEETASTKSTASAKTVAVPKAATPSGSGAGTQEKENKLPDSSLPKTPVQKYEGSGTVLKTTPKVTFEPKEQVVKGETEAVEVTEAANEQVHLVAGAGSAPSLLSRGVNAYIFIAVGILLSLFIKKKKD